MIVKFFANKSGGSGASIDYLLDKERVEKGTARILQGDERLTRELIKSMSQKNKVCVGCLSFEEANISEELKKELMQSFESMLFTQEMQGRYNILWVEHTDKGRLELNFVVPKIDLESQKAFNPYFHIADCKRKDLWTDYVNLKHNFTNPKDPAKENTIQGSKKELGLIKDYQALDKYLHEQVSEGIISSREDILSLLKDNNIEVSRMGKDYISVTLPNSNKSKRFKGGIYDEKFTSISELGEISRSDKERERAFRERNTPAEIDRIKQQLDNHIQHKARFYAERNAREKQRATSDKVKEFGDSMRIYSVNNADFVRDCVESVDKTLSNPQRTHDTRREGQTIYRDRQDTSNGIQRETLHSPLLGDPNDHIRERTYGRSREITRRAWQCIDNATKRAESEREIANNAKRRAEAQRGIMQRMRELKDHLQQIFRGFSDYIAEIQERKRRELMKKQQEQERTRIRDRGFSR